MKHPTAAARATRPSRAHGVALSFLAPALALAGSAACAQVLDDENRSESGAASAALDRNVDRNMDRSADRTFAPRVTRTDLELRGAPAAAAGAFAGTAGQDLQADSVRLSDVSVRWWSTHGRTDWGVGVGAISLSGRTLGAAPGSPPIVLGSAPSLTVGMRYRASPHSTVFADASGAPGLGQNSGDAYIGKVGVEWKPASLASRWNLSYGGIGWRLSADSRMTLRVKSGGVGLYVRSQFY